MNNKMNNKTFFFADHYGPFIMLGNGHIPAFLYNAEYPIVFDPGVSAFGPYYYRMIEKYTGQRRDYFTVLLTHSHFDHCGAIPYLRRKLPGIRVGSSIRAAEILQKPSAIALIKRFNAEYEQQIADALRDEDVSFEAIDIDLKLKEGDLIELSGTTCTVIETPGHTRDCLSYFFPDSGVFVVGEAAGVPEGEYIHSAFLSSYEQYINSIERIVSLHPNALCIAHVGIICGSEVFHYLEASLQSAREQREKIEKYLITYNGDKDKVVERITAEEYDAKSEHIVNRNPFIANLHAKVNAVIQVAST